MALRRIAPPPDAEQKPDAKIPGTEAWWQMLGYDTRTVPFSEVLALPRRITKNVD